MKRLSKSVNSIEVCVYVDNKITIKIGLIEPQGFLRSEKGRKGKNNEFGIDVLH